MQRPKYPFELIDGMTGVVVCIYKAFSIALRDCRRKNQLERRFYVRRIADGRKFN
jgi:hypothetical protein